MANWAELPRELLQLVVKRLSSEDYLNFAMVCTSWQSVAAENYNPKTKPPWLVDLYNSADLFSLAGLERGRELPSERGFWFQHIYGGWMAKGEIDRGLTLFNPFTRASIKLPPLKVSSIVSYSEQRLAISANPSHSADYSVMISFRNEFEQHMWVWRSKQRAWKRVGVPPASDIILLTHYRGQFVALDTKFQMLTLAEDDITEGRFQVRMKVDKGGLSYYRLYFVECWGSLLLICSKGTMFRVIEVDLERVKCRESKGLGNASLFLNRERFYSSFCLELDDADESTLLCVQPNCIYYFDSERGFCIGIYHMDDGRVEWKFEGKWISSSTPLAWIQPCF